ncbi:MAG TPA: tape measure protein [Candidatus Enterenecus stercoripullorum]|nr:tape measure protein [Candidatus Enterenecus stercoripullorum]
MPKNGVSLYFTIRDGGSQVLSAIGDKTKALDKETQSLAQAQQALQKANESLTRRQTELKTALEKSQVAVKDARSEFRKLHDEASGNKLQDAIEEQEELKRSLRDVEDQLKSNSKTFNEYRETLRKGSAGSGSGGSGSSVLSTLGQAGAFAFLGDAAAQWGTTLADSAFGNGAGSVLSSALSGAGSGAAIGSMIGGPVGTAIGAALGLVVGGLSGGSQIYEEQDDAFKSYVQEGAESALSDQQERTETGSTIAGSREQTQMAFAQRLGSDEAAAEYLAQVRTMAARTNYGYDEITGYSKLLLNSYDPEEVFGVLQSLSDATAALDLSSSDIEVMISGLSRMRTTGKATQEYLNFFSERGVDVYDALGQAIGVDKSQVSDMVTDGEIGGVEAAQAILDYIDQEFGGLSEKLMGTYDAMVDNLSDAEANLQARAGEGYNETRKQGIQAQQEWMEDKEGELGDAYSMIGQWQASLENLAEEYERAALDAVMSGTASDLYEGSDQQARLEELAQEYQSALADYEAGNEEAGARMGQLLAEAQIIAQNEYNASEGAQLALQSQLDLAETIREDTASNEAYWNAGYRKGQEFSKGMAAAWWRGGSSDVEPGAMILNAAGEVVPAGGYAMGLDRVPYDNFPALLHEGERVLTANEARAMDQANGVQVSIGSVSIGGSLGGVSILDIAMEIAKELERAAVVAVPR